LVAVLRFLRRTPIAQKIGAFEKFLVPIKEIAVVGRTKIRVRVEFRDGDSDCVWQRSLRFSLPHEFESDPDFLLAFEKVVLPIEEIASWDERKSGPESNFGMAIRAASGSEACALAFRMNSNPTSIFSRFDFQCPA